MRGSGLLCRSTQCKETALINALTIGLEAIPEKCPYQIRVYPVWPIHCYGSGVFKRYFALVDH
jgi:hypothetical protein